MVLIEYAIHVLSVDELELRRTLKSLACGDQKLLRKSPDTEDVDDTDTFTYNEDYTASTQRIRMNTEKLKEVIDSNANVPRAVLMNRENQASHHLPFRVIRCSNPLLNTGGCCHSENHEIQAAIKSWCAIE